MSRSYPSKLHATISVVERDHFWFRGRRDIVQRVLQHFSGVVHKKTFLEVGFGTGELLSVVERIGFTVFGVDINKKAQIYAQKRSRATLYIKPFLRFTHHSYDAIGMFDVLEHQDNDVSFLSHAYTLLKNNGLLFLTVPAGPRLWSDIDQLSGHKRRYTKQAILIALEKSGFTPLWCNYWNMFLTPFYAVWKIVNAKVHSATPEDFVAPINPILNTLFFYSITIENKLTLYIPFLFGTSLIVVARKKRTYS